MRFPLSMTAGMAKYIFKNKFNPRPEWQKHVAPKAGAGRIPRCNSGQADETARMRSRCIVQPSVISFRCARISRAAL